jgi:hypothetical protein
MIESLNAIRSLGLAPVFEDLYFGREVPADLRIHMSYPNRFRETSLSDWLPLTEGGLIPIVDDGNFYDICLYDPHRRKFMVKFIEEPGTVAREFDSWQQFLAYKLLEIADSGPEDAALAEVAEAVGFNHTPRLLALLREMEALPDAEIDERAERFIQECLA